MSPERAWSIYQTLVYADVFNYPLTSREVWLYLISNRLVAEEVVNRALTELVAGPKAKIAFQNGYYCLAGRENLIPRRRSNQQDLTAKEIVVQKSLGRITKVPGVLFVGLTGDLALGIAKPEEDIDLFIICRKGSLWSSRFWVTLAVDLVGQRRKPGETNIKNKICLNMFIDTSALALPEKERDVYLAHEIIQLKPLFDRGNTYFRFLKANKWVRTYLANAYYHRISKLKSQTGKSQVPNPKSQILDAFFRLIEPLARASQLWYMRSRVTSEILASNLIRFHPQDVRQWVLPAYKKRLKWLKTAGQHLPKSQFLGPKEASTPAFKSSPLCSEEKLPLDKLRKGCYKIAAAGEDCQSS